MAIDPDYLLNRAPVVVEQEWRARDTILYALGVGCEELEFVYEEKLLALPTMAVVLGYPGFMWRNPEMGADWTKILHGEQSIIIHTPLPAEGVFIGENRITHLFDKGPDKGAIALVKRSIKGKDGTHYADTIATMAVLAVARKARLFRIPCLKTARQIIRNPCAPHATPRSSIVCPAISIPCTLTAGLRNLRDLNGQSFTDWPRWALWAAASCPS
jgi:hypothetical protein